MVINKQIRNCKIIVTVSEFSCEIIARILQGFCYARH